MKFLILASILILFPIGIQESFAEQASGKPTWDTNSDNVCGDRLCSDIQESYNSCDIKEFREMLQQSNRILIGTVIDVDPTKTIATMSPEFMFPFSYSSVEIVVNTNDVDNKYYFTVGEKLLIHHDDVWIQDTSDYGVADYGVTLYSDACRIKHVENIQNDLREFNSWLFAHQRIPSVANFYTADNSGIFVETPNVNQKIYFKFDITNLGFLDTFFVAYIQIKDETGQILSIEQVTDILKIGKATSPKISWMPPYAGTFSATLFCWDNESWTPLSYPIMTTTTVQ